jgi:acetyl esterase/lipase
MTPNPRLACAMLSILLICPMTGQAVQVIPLEPGSVVRPLATDYDPANPNQDRFAEGSDVETPALTYFPAPRAAKPAAAIIICPGGGYSGQAVDKEGYKPALWLNSLGITAFVLRYRVPHGEAGHGMVPPSLEDVQHAVLLVRKNAKKWGLDPTEIGVMGWSAGGHLAAMSGTLFQEPQWWNVDLRGLGDRPDFLVLLYPVITMGEAAHKGSRENLLGSNPSADALRRYSMEKQITSLTPPTFIALARDDDAVPMENSVLFADALKAAGVPCTLVIYEHGGHGFGLGKKGDDSARWPEAFAVWAGRKGLLRPQVR